MFALTKEPYFSTPYIIKEYDNVRIAIVGLTADGLMKNEFAEMEKEVSIEKALLSAKRWIRYIHESEHPDFLIVIYHGGLYKINQTNTRHRKVLMKRKNNEGNRCDRFNDNSAPASNDYR